MKTETPRPLNNELKARLLSGARDLASDPADLKAQGETIRAIADLQLRKAEGIEIGRFKAYDSKSILALAVLILSLAAFFWVVSPFLGGWIRDWKQAEKPVSAAVEGDVSQ